ncbi:MAG: LicD family protein [Eubacterium sp.]|nr:LicD family protein [Eubacterium sp.]
MHFSEEFFEDEIRDGFYIPGMVKRGWACEMEVLSEIDKICQKYGIEYFADWGSLLATVRHGGFIPWDDDLDIAMKRSEYKKFLTHLSELPDGYEIINYHTNEDYWQFLSRIVGKKRICFEEDHLEKFHQFPYICGVDIFILDYRSDNEKKENERCTLAKYIIAVSDAIEDGSLSGVKLEESLKKIESLSRKKLPRGLSDYDLRIKLYELCEEVFDMYNSEKGKRITQLFPFGIDNPDFSFPSEYYENSIRLPYENTTIPVPLEYTAVLDKRYPNFMQLIKTWSGHDYPYFSTQQKDLEAVLDFELPKFKFTPDLLSKPSAPEGATYKAVVTEYNSALISLLSSLTQALANGNGSEVKELCQNAQQLATEMGTLIEQWKGEGTAIVSCLEELCELVFAIYSGENDGSSVTGLSDRILGAFNDIISRKEVVFLPFKAEYFERFMPYYQKALEDENTDVYVVPLPYYYKKYDSTLHDMHYDILDYPKELHPLSIEDFNLFAHRPDEIYFQNPYDEWNDTTSLPKGFFSKALSSACEKLIYVPWFEMASFTKEDTVPFTNSEKYVTMPGVIRADEIILEEEWLKEIYVERLSLFSGEDTRSIWENKIKVSSVKRNRSGCKPPVPKDWADKLKKSDGGTKKVILYAPSISVLCACEDDMPKKLSLIKETFSTYKDSLCPLWFEDENIDKELPKINPALYSIYSKTRDEFKAEDFGIYDDSGNKERAIGLCDALYGDGGEIAHRVRMSGKPVMLENPKI